MTDKLKIILCGQKSFGAAVFDMLREQKNIELKAVFAPDDDKLAGRAAVYHVPLRLAGTLRADTMPKDCDLIVAAHSHDFISRAVRNRLRLGAIGYHPSLLPFHRGRDAVRWTIRMREQITGGTVFWLNDTVDGGPVAKQDWCMIAPDDNVHTLWRNKLFPMGIRLLRETINDIAAGRLIMKEQEHKMATWEPAFDGAPRLFRPEIPQIGFLPDGFEILKE